MSHFLGFYPILRWVDLVEKRLQSDVNISTLSQMMILFLSLSLRQEVSNKMLSSGQCTAEDLCFSLQVLRTKSLSSPVSVVLLRMAEL